jgi:hypothetical protein
MTFTIRRTYNVHGDHDWLVAIDADGTPSWMGAEKLARLFTENDIEAALATIAAYRDHLCPDGIKGVQAIQL